MNINAIYFYGEAMILSGNERMDKSMMVLPVLNL